MSRHTIDDHDRLIGRLPDADRERVLADIVRGTQHGSTVHVEWSSFRNLEPDFLRGVTGRIVGLGVSYGGGSSADVLVVAPVDITRRLVVLPAAQLVRVRWAYAPAGSTNPADYDLGLVIAGPPL